MISLENDQWKCKALLSSFSHWHVKGFSSKCIALKVDAIGLENILFVGGSVHLSAQKFYRLGQWWGLRKWSLMWCTDQYISNFVFCTDSNIIIFSFCFFFLWSVNETSTARGCCFQHCGCVADATPFCLGSHAQLFVIRRMSTTKNGHYNYSPERLSWTTCSRLQ